MRNFCIRDTRWNNRGHELDALGAHIVQAERLFYLVGTDREMQIFREEFESAIRIAGCVHSQVACEEGAVACSPQKAEGMPSPDQGSIICVSTTREDYEANVRYWTARGYTENGTFFQSDVFRAVFPLYARGEIRLDRVEIFMTSHCTLNCEKCIAYIPFFTKRRHMPLATLTQDLDLLFGKVDFIYKLKLLGGEVLLYPQLIAYLEYFCERYRKQAGTVRLGTNATLMPAQPLLDICRKHDIMMDISDYGEAVRELCRIDELAALLQSQGIGYTVKRTGEQWLDMGFPGNPAHFSNQSAVMEHFHKCAMFCREFYDGRLYFCCSNFAAVQAGLFPADENDYLDFRRELSKKEILEFETGFSHLGHTTFCTVCRGCSMEANAMSVPVAKQMGKNTCK